MKDAPRLSGSLRVTGRVVALPEAGASSARPSLRRQAWSRGPQPHWGGDANGARQSRFRGVRVDGLLRGRLIFHASWVARSAVEN